MDYAFRFYRHDLITKFERDFDEFLKNNTKKLILNSDDKPYLHTVYMYFRDGLKIEVENYTTTMFHDSVPNMDDDLIPELFRNSGINFKINIVRDTSYSPPLVKMSFTKLY